MRGQAVTSKRVTYLSHARLQVLARVVRSGLELDGSVVHDVGEARGVAHVRVVLGNQNRGQLLQVAVPDGESRALVRDGAAIRGLLYLVLLAADDNSRPLQRTHPEEGTLHTFDTYLERDDVGVVTTAC
jgi:hypothetical protein